MKNVLFIICTLCNLKCKHYHLLHCKDRILSLKQFSLLDKDLTYITVGISMYL
jgi:hypothetical protein